MYSENITTPGFTVAVGDYDGNVESPATAEQVNILELFVLYYEKIYAFQFIKVIKLINLACLSTPPEMINYAIGC